MSNRKLFRCAGLLRDRSQACSFIGTSSLQPLFPLTQRNGLMGEAARPLEEVEQRSPVVVFMLRRDSALGNGENSLRRENQVWSYGGPVCITADAASGPSPQQTFFRQLWRKREKTDEEEKVSLPADLIALSVNKRITNGELIALRDTLA